jgi:hypothetical protein
VHPNAVHRNAERTTETTEAAGAQGKFWEMHDTLFENQDALEDEDLLEYAAAIGLDLTRFSREMIEHRYAERIHEDFLGGVRSGVNGTPTFFILMPVRQRLRFADQKALNKMYVFAAVPAGNKKLGMEDYCLDFIVAFIPVLDVALLLAFSSDASILTKKPAEAKPATNARVLTTRQFGKAKKQKLA